MSSRQPVTGAKDIGIGAAIGGFSGTFGVGGGLVLVPLLVLGRGMEQKRAQATSLVMVFTAAGGGAVIYALNASIAWLPAAIIAVGGLIGSWLGAHTVLRAPSHGLQLIFGFLLVAVAVRLLLTVAPGAEASQAIAELSLLSGLGYVISGLTMGFLSALLGIGGGIILIPILVTGFGYQQQLASGTSLAVMLPIAALGAYRLSQVGLTDWPMGFRFGLGSVPGAAVGALVAMSLSPLILRYAFAVIMVIIGVRMAYLGWRAWRRGQTSVPIA